MQSTRLGEARAFYARLCGDTAVVAETPTAHFRFQYGYCICKRIQPGSEIWVSGWLEGGWHFVFVCPSFMRSSDQFQAFLGVPPPKVSAVVARQPTNDSVALVGHYSGKLPATRSTSVSCISTFNFTFLSLFR